MDDVNSPGKKETPPASLVPKILANAISFLSPIKSEIPSPDDKKSSEEVKRNNEVVPPSAKTEMLPPDDKRSSEEVKRSDENSLSDNIFDCHFCHSRTELSLSQVIPSLFSVVKSQILKSAHMNLHDVRAWLSNHQAKDLPFAWKQQLDEGKKIIIEPNVENYDIWYIGDIHGDILSCEVALNFIFARNPSATVVFLGDLIDRQPYSLEVFSKVIAYVLKYPGQILWIAGNHDIGLRYDEDSRKFISTVEPAEFSSWLNEHPKYTDLGKFFIEITQYLPRALFLGDGLCVVHGGVPGKEQLASILEFSDLSSLIALDAYSSNRLNPDKPRARGKELGWENVHSFLEKATTLLAFKVTQILRGHDHCEKDRYLFYDKYKENPVLTFVTLSAWTTDETYFRNLYNSIATSLIVAHHRKGLLPEVIELTIPEKLITEFWEVCKAPANKAEKG